MTSQIWFPNVFSGSGSGGSASSLYANVFDGDNTGATDVSAALKTTIDAAKAANEALFVPEGRYLLSTPQTIQFSDGEKSIIRGAGYSTQFIIPSGSTTQPLYLSGLQETIDNTSREVSVTAVANLEYTTVAGIEGSSSEVTKVTVSSSTGLIVGQMVSLISDTLITYARDSWTTTSGAAVDDQFNWQHEMARILAISGNDIYLNRKLHYSASSYNGANYKALRYYPTETVVDWKDFIFTTTGTRDEVRTTVVDRPTAAVFIYGIDKVKWEVDFEYAWAGTVRVGTVIEPYVKSHVEYCPNGVTGGFALGYHGILDGTMYGGKFILTSSDGVRHAGTSTYLEEAGIVINNTGFTAGASTTLGFTTTGNTPVINDRIYIDLSTATGTISTMPVGTYLVTNRVGATVTVAYNSVGNTFTAGSGYGVLLQGDIKHRYGSVIGAEIQADATSALGALLDPHENTIDVVHSGSVLSAVGYTQGNTSGRLANTRGLRDSYKNLRQKGGAGFIATDSFSRQFGSPNIVTIDDFEIIEQANNSQASYSLFDLEGSSNVTDKRELYVTNGKIIGEQGRFLDYRRYSADIVVFENIKYLAETFVVSTIPTKTMMSVEGGSLLFKNCLFDFTRSANSNVRMLVQDTSASTVLFEDCEFRGIPSPSSAPSSYLFVQNITGCTIGFRRCKFSIIGAGTGLRWLQVGTGFAGNVLYDSCDFTGMGRISTTTGMAYGNGAGSVANVIERNCTYDGVRHFKSNASATMCVASSSDVNTTAVGTPASTAETTLMSQNFPANSLNATGEKVKFSAWGLTANNANVKTLRIKFGTATIFTRTLTVSAANTWSVEGYVITTGSNAQTYVITSAFDGATAITPTRGTTTETATAAITFAVTGQNGTANANDIICQGLILEVTP